MIRNRLDYYGGARKTSLVEDLPEENEMERLVKLDLQTLEVLRDEAKKACKKASRQFEKYDNSDDMHDMENWQHVIDWLDTKIKDHG